MKETNANIKNIKIDIISHTSKTGSSITFDSITLTIIIHGIVNKKVVPKATNLSFNSPNGTMRMFGSGRKFLIIFQKYKKRPDGQMPTGRILTTHKL